MKSSMALAVPSWKSSSLAYRLTVYLQVDFIMNSKVGKSQRPYFSWAESVWQGEQALQRRLSHTSEDNHVHSRELPLVL